MWNWNLPNYRLKILCIAALCESLLTINWIRSMLGGIQVLRKNLNSVIKLLIDCQGRFYSTWSQYTISYQYLVCVPVNFCGKFRLGTGLDLGVCAPPAPTWNHQCGSLVISSSVLWNQCGQFCGCWSSESSRYFLSKNWEFISETHV
jgi:hypothetical protein